MTMRMPTESSSWDATPGVHGRLELSFARRGARTVLSRQHAATPLHVQGLLGRQDGGDPYAEVAVLNVAGGVLAGDLLEQCFIVGPGAAARVLTVGATRLYRARGGGDRPARQCTTLQVAAGARLEYLPDELIPYAGALYESETRLDVEPGGYAVVSEVVGPGRLHRGEVFAYRRLTLRVRADRAGTPLLRDTLRLEPQVWPPSAGPILGAYTHLATLYAFGLTTGAGALLATELHSLLEERGLYGGATVGHGDTVILRAVGHSAYTLVQAVRAAAVLCRQSKEHS